MTELQREFVLAERADKRNAELLRQKLLKKVGARAGWWRWDLRVLPVVPHVHAVLIIVQRPAPARPAACPAARPCLAHHHLPAAQSDAKAAAAGAKAAKSVRGKSGREERWVCWGTPVRHSAATGGKPRLLRGDLQWGPGACAGVCSPAQCGDRGPPARGQGATGTMLYFIFSAAPACLGALQGGSRQEAGNRGAQGGSGAQEGGGRGAVGGGREAWLLRAPGLQRRQGAAGRLVAWLHGLLPLRSGSEHGCVETLLQALEGGGGERHG